MGSGYVLLSKVTSGLYNPGGLGRQHRHFNKSFWKDLEHYLEHAKNVV